MGSRRRGGFTLVELLIVVIIIAILAAIAIAKFGNSSQRSREAALRAELKTLRNAVELFKGDTGCYPPSFDAFTSQPTQCIQPDGSTITIPTNSWRGPYVSNVGPNPVTGNHPGYTYTNSGTPSSQPPLGNISAESGTATDGTNYNTW